jgi:hypothetical protein
MRLRSQIPHVTCAFAWNKDEVKNLFEDFILLKSESTKNILYGEFFSVLLILI